MSNNRLIFEGMAEFRQQLRDLPKELAAEGGAIVMAAGDDAKAEITAAYPARTGNLKKGMSVKRDTSAFGTSVTVKNSAKHAYIFENGTQTRQTSLGANRGAMPPGNVFVPVMVRRRRAMYEKLKDLLVRQGLQVSGTP